MMKKLIAVWILLGCLCTFFPASAEEFPAPTASEFSVASIFTDNMVLQRDKDIKIWGASPNENAVIHVRMGNSTAYAYVQNGYWEATLAARAYTTEPAAIEIIGGEQAEHIFLENIVIGDIWWVLGQSNIEYTASIMPEWESMTFGAEPIRVFTLNSHDLTRTTAPAGFTAQSRKWRPLTKLTAAEASAIGVCFTKTIAAQTSGEIPVGLLSMGFRGMDLASFVPPSISKEMTAIAEKSLVYNRVISMMDRLPIKGLIWYQGEANGTTYAEYSEKFCDFANYLRGRMGDFPIYIVELPPCYPKQETADNADAWQFLDYGVVRGELGILPMELDDVYLCTTSDLWNDKNYYNNLHPVNKAAIAARLVTGAMATAYDRGGADTFLPPTVSLVYYGASKNEVFIEYKNTAGCLSTHWGEPQIKGFEVIDEKWAFIPNTVERINPNTIHITAERDICIVRYGCNTGDTFGETLNLQSSSQLPAAAFSYMLQSPKDMTRFLVRAWHFGKWLLLQYWPIWSALALLIVAGLWFFLRRRKRKALKEK